jgi:hypothetical protein
MAARKTRQYTRLPDDSGGEMDDRTTLTEDELKTEGFADRRSEVADADQDDPDSDAGDADADDTDADADDSDS